MYYRLSSLKKLKVLDVGGNNFSHGLPTVITEITSLETLHLNNCQLSELPERYKHNMLLLVKVVSSSSACVSVYCLDFQGSGA